MGEKKVIDCEAFSNTMSNLPERKHYNVSERLSGLSAFQAGLLKTDLEMLDTGPKQHHRLL